MFIQVSYSGEMEPYCAKTVLLHLTHQMGLEVDSITTDRSTTMRSMIRLVHTSLGQSKVLVAET